MIRLQTVDKVKCPTKIVFSHEFIFQQFSQQARNQEKIKPKVSTKSVAVLISKTAVGCFGIYDTHFFFFFYLQYLRDRINETTNCCWLAQFPTNRS